ncbi:MAG: nucleotidyltransferase [Clostridia bacterium]|nr:nucleotidyltransferase [Candidatus Limimonas egerieequi]MCQ2489461.1 nucleotidyltransferase [Clostridia bacterium]
MKTTLVIMAAGIGSRFGGGIKQMEPLGPSGEIIIDYSIHDAIEAGFDKVVFIIRHDLEKDFKEVIGDRIAQKIEVEYAFQEKEDLPEGFSVGERKKPWGTGQAILAAIDVVKEPFAVINADDYYGKEGFKVVHDWLVSGGATTDSKRHFCMAGFELRNTLSENGGVTRGVCQADENGFMTDILETENIEKIDGKAGVRTDNGINFYPDDTLVSMNMWGIGPDFIEGVLKPGFVEFLKNLPEGNIKAEYLLPMVIGELVEKGEADVKILHTPDKWFGVTYADDKYAVKEAFKDLVAKGVYPENIK